jgi:hypothetical protein
MRRNLVIFFLAVIVFGFVFSFAVADAQSQVGKDPGWSGIVPCGRSSGTAAENAPCTLCHFIIGFQRLVQYGLYMVITLALVGIFFAGVMYIISSGDEGMMTNAKGFLKASLIGFAVTLGAWLIVSTVLWILGASQNNLGIGRTSWNNFTCNVTSSVPRTNP